MLSGVQLLSEQNFICQKPFIQMFFWRGALRASIINIFYPYLQTLSLRILMEFHNKRALQYLPIGFALVVYIAGWFIDLMQEDAAQYGSIAQEMMQNGSYLQVKHRGADYLDKPPLLFWLVSFSFKLFGVHNFAYRIPSFIFLC